MTAISDMADAIGDSLNGANPAWPTICAQAAIRALEGHSVLDAAREDGVLALGTLWFPDIVFETEIDGEGLWVAIAKKSASDFGNGHRWSAVSRAHAMMEALSDLIDFDDDQKRASA